MVFPFPLRENRQLLPLQKLELQFNLPLITAFQAANLEKGGINFGFFLGCLFSKDQFGAGLSKPDEAERGQA